MVSRWPLLWRLANSMNLFTGEGMMRRWCLPLVAMAFGLGACTYSPGVYDRIIAYNKSVAASTNALLLLNTLRARDRLPTYYTRTTGDTATSTINPSLTLSIPFGPFAKSADIMSGGLTASEASQLALQNLDDQKYVRGTLTPIHGDVLGFYLQQGWPPEVLLMVTVSKISINKAALDALVASFTTMCANDPSSRYCNSSLPLGTQLPASGQYLSSRVTDCAQADIKEGDEADKKFAFANYPTDGPELGCFQALMRLIIALGPEAKSVDTLKVLAASLPVSGRFSPADVAELDKQNLVLGNAAGKFVVCRRTQTSQFALSRLLTGTSTSFVSPASDTGGDDKTFLASARPSGAKADCSALVAADKSRDTEKAGSEPLRVEFTTRSFDGMVYYLGEILRAEANSPAADTTVWTFNLNQRRFEPWTLYEAVAGSWSGQGAVSVDYNGTSYVIPAACANSETCASADGKHLSLQVLAMLNQIWGLEKEEATQPLVPTVTVVNP
jgi:hypothetical protein